MRTRAFSLVEILVAAVVIGLAAVPMLSVLSSSNRVSKASIYEIMAVQYAEELGQQLMRLSTKLRPIREATGKDLKNLLEDPSVQGLLAPTGGGMTAPLAVPLPATDLVVFASPLGPNFLSRTITVTPLDTTGRQVFRHGHFWGVTIGLSWRMAPNDPIVHGASFALVLRE